MKSSKFFGIGIFLAVSLMVMVTLAMARGGAGFHGQGYGQGPGYNQWQAGEGYPGYQGRYGYENCPALEELSDEQKQQFYQLVQEHREAMYAYRQTKITLQTAFNALLMDPEADPAEIETLKNELSDLNQEMYNARLDHWIRLSRDFGINRPALGQGGSGWRGQGRYAARGNCPRGRW